MTKARRSSAAFGAVLFGALAITCAALGHSTAGTNAGGPAPVHLVAETVAASTSTPAKSGPSTSASAPAAGFSAPATRASGGAAASASPVTEGPAVPADADQSATAGQVTNDASRFLADASGRQQITFDGPSGSSPDPRVWNFETGGSGWGNGELETYTRSPRNAFLDGLGHLVIRGLRQTVTGADGIQRDFTSARISTQGKVVIQPGSYVEATLTAPTGAGVWPAFWLIGTDVDQVGWPRSGELDVFEGNGGPTIAHSAVHLSSASDPSVDEQYGWGLPGATVDVGERLDASPHSYGVYFDGSVVRFYIDRKEHMVVTAADAQATGRLWPFGEPQYLILDVAADGSGAAYQVTTQQQMTVYNISVWPNLPFSAS